MVRKIAIIGSAAMLLAAPCAFAQQTNGAAGTDSTSARQLNRATSEQGTPAATMGRSNSTDSVNGPGQTGTPGTMAPAMGSQSK